MNTNLLALDHAIEQFSQPLWPSDVAKYAYRVFCDVLSPQSSALFINDAACEFVELESHHYPSNKMVELTPELTQLPLFHAGLLSKRMNRWFGSEFIKDFSPTLIIPLTIKQRLYGFIVMRGSPITSEQSQYAQSILYLVQSALERGEQIRAIALLQKEFEKYQFTMMSLQMYTTSLLTHNSLSALYQQAVDAFSELARSNITSLGVWDEYRDRITIVEYSEKRGRKKQYAEFFLQSPQNNTNVCRLYDIEKESRELLNIFTSLKEFETLSAKYVILLGKDSTVLGFVTLNESPVIEEDIRFYETIQLLASITYIAIMQARQWEEVMYQKALNEHKVELLNNLNHLAENLGMCEDLDELMELTMQSLSLHAGVEKAFIAVKDGEKWITESVGMQNAEVDGDIVYSWFVETEDEIFNYTSDGAKNQLGEIGNFLDDVNCLVSFPLWQHSAQVGSERFRRDNFMGCICVLKVRDGLKEDSHAVVRAISRSVHPFVIIHARGEHQVNGLHA